MEHAIVMSIARLYWRKQHLSTFRLAELARERVSQIMSAALPDDSCWLENPDPIAPAERAALIREANEQAREELGQTYELVEMGNAVTIESLNKELAVEDRIDTMIDRCFKRLLMVRGIKTMPAISPTAPPHRALKGPDAA
jgi:hypothetical protein